jgi:hypothetical protein
MSILNRARGLFSVGSSTRRQPRARQAHLRVEQLEQRDVPAPIATPPVFQNPFMAPNNFSEIHLNSSQTDTFSVPGPGRAPGHAVQQGLIGPLPDGISGTLAFNAKGQILTIRVGGSGSQSLLLLDPVTLKVLAKKALPPRPNSGGGVSFAGGGYFYLDNQGRVVCVTATQQIRIYSILGQHFHRDRTFDLRVTINNSSDILNSVLPDKDGNLWFISKLGVVGYVNPSSGEIHVSNLRDVPGAGPNETNTKSFASDANGGVYIVSDRALYRFQAGPGGAVQDIWRAPYDPGVRTKPGQNQQGSGTTPTVFDDFEGNQFVAITDNADPFMHVNVYNRLTGALVARQAVFPNSPFQNSCENSLIAVNHSILVENNYGNSTPKSALNSRTTVPGIDRVDFTPAGESHLAWDNTSVAVPSVVSQLSTADGLEYTYAKDQKGWYWAALNFALDPGKTVTGRVVDGAGKAVAGASAGGLTATHDVPVTLPDDTFVARALDPGHPRTVAVFHRAGKLAGTLQLRGDEKEPPVLRLRPWGTVAGKVVDIDGSPRAGIGISPVFRDLTLSPLYFARFHPQTEPVRTDRDGCFRLDIPFADQPFMLVPTSKKGRPLDTGGLYETWTVASGKVKELPPITVRGPLGEQ